MSVLSTFQVRLRRRRGSSMQCRRRPPAGARAPHARMCDALSMRSSTARMRARALRGGAGGGAGGAAASGVGACACGL